MRVFIRKLGNSAAVRIPAEIMEAARLGVGDPVDVRQKGGRIVISPLRMNRFDLAKMLDAIAPANLHAGIEFGAPMGREIL